MNRSSSVAVVALVAIAGCSTGQGNQSGAASPSIGGPDQSATAIATMTTKPAETDSPQASRVPAEFPDRELQAGSYTVAPFTAGEGMCHVPPQTGCSESAADDAIRVTVTVPDGWSGFGNGIWLTGPGNGPPDGAGLLLLRGAWLLSDPCKYIAADVTVGPTVGDFVNAVAEHPILDTTAPVDVTLAGYSGKYFDLQVPADISTCETEPGNASSGPIYRPWEPGIYAQGPRQRWHLWVLDVDGVRVVVQSSDFAETSEQRRTELQAMVDSLKIER